MAEITKPPAPLEHTVTIPVREYPEKTLFLRENWASGEIHGEKFELTRSMGGDGAIIRIGKRWFVVPMKEVVQAIYGQLVDNKAGDDG